ncbi:MAG: helix-turn-helix domain-containing protein, partial [Arenibacterium sp.]
MSEQYNFDRKKGFVALPVELFDLDLTPGAFRTLTELCRMANAEGYCWPSLEQLSERLGRSRSAISGYIKELRDIGLVVTQEQKTANGYNYRLKYKVTFWQDWRASLSPVRPAKSDRRVHPVERTIESKNQSLIKPKPKESDLDRLLKSWQSCFAGAPYPSVGRPPEEGLRNKTIACLEQPVAPPAPDGKLTQALNSLWTDLGIPADHSALSDHCQTLKKSDFSEAELNQVLTLIKKSWPRHWQKSPSQDAFEKLVRDTGIVARARKLTVLNGYYQRWMRAQNSLQRTATSCSVA